jgi:acyl carrier protein
MEEQLLEIISKYLKRDKNDINIDTKLTLDSLDSVELSLEIEDTFDIEFSDKELAEVKTIRDYIKIIKEKEK